MKKYNGINLMKYLMAVCVIAIHLQPLVKVNNEYLLNFYESIIYLAVPFFFIVTGFLIGQRLSCLDKYSLKDGDILKKRIKKVLKLYIVFNIVYLPLTLYGYLKFGYSITFCIQDFIRGFILVGEHYNSWVLWYLLSEFYGLCLIYFLYKKGVNFKNIIYVGIFFYVLGISINYIFELDVTTGLMGKIKELLQYLFGYYNLSGRLFTSMLYLSIGMYLSRYNPYKFKIMYVILLILSAIIINTTITNYVLDQIMIVISSILLFILSLRLEFRDNVIFEYLRLTSIDMYFWHLFVWTILDIVLYKKLIYGIISFTIVYLLMNIIGLIHYAWVNKFKKYD